MTKTILLADDSLTIQKVVELTFADTPYNVVAVSSGDELLEKVSDINPELIICDIIMPGRDGYDVCQDIKSSPDTLHIPVILLSGTFEPLDRDRALAVGCSEILTKPFEARKLIDTVERLISRRDDNAAAGTDDARSRSADTGPVSPYVASSADFGTRMSTAADDFHAMDASDVSAPGEQLSEGLDFTETGFAEMEAAAVNASDRRGAAPDDGLEFEVGVGGSDIDPFADLDAEEPVGRPDHDLADAFNAGDEPFAGASEEIDHSSTDGAVFGSPRPFVADAAVGIDDLTDVTEEDSAFEADAEIGNSAFADEPVLGGGVGEMLDEPDLQLQSAEDAFGGGPSFITDADTAPLPPLDAADGEPRETPQVEPTPVAGRLSDDDIDRIAHRLLELADERIEQIAWEVIPDVAEIVVRERIRRLEAELETEN